MSNWDPSEHPREPAGAPNSIGGRFTTVASPIERKLTAKQRSLEERMLDPEGGFTYQPVTQDEPKEGFAVSIFEGRSQSFDPKTVTFETLGDYYLKNMDALDDPSNYLGAWHFEGKLYLDVSRVVKSRDEAIRLAREHDQIGIYDLGKGEEIIVDRNAKSGGAA